MDLASVRLIAVDLDGTLVRSNGTVSRKVREVVRQLELMGVKFVIATGRPTASALSIYKWLGLKNPVIACNGAHILITREEASGPSKNESTCNSGGLIGYEEARFVPIEKKLALDLLELLRKSGIYFHVHLKGCYAVERQYLVKARKRPFSLKRFVKRIGAVKPASPMRILKSGTTENYAGEIPKICVDGSKEQVSRVKTAIQEAFGPALQCVMTGPTFMEVMDARINKGEALLFLGERLGISPSQMAALGDGDNDVEMLKSVGVGVAMANASPALCLAADRFTFSCDDDGVVEFLNQVRAEKAAVCTFPQIKRKRAI